MDSSSASPISAYFRQDRIIPAKVMVDIASGHVYDESGVSPYEDWKADRLKRAEKSRENFEIFHLHELAPEQEGELCRAYANYIRKLFQPEELTKHILIQILEKAERLGGKELVEVLKKESGYQEPPERDVTEIKNGVRTTVRKRWAHLEDRSPQTHRKKVERFNGMDGDWHYAEFVKDIVAQKGLSEDFNVAAEESLQKVLFDTKLPIKWDRQQHKVVITVDEREFDDAVSASIKAKEKNFKSNLIKCRDEVKKIADRTETANPYFKDLSQEEAAHTVSKIIENLSATITPDSLAELMIKIALSDPHLSMVVVNDNNVEWIARQRSEDSVTRGFANQSDNMIALSSRCKAGTLAEELIHHAFLRVFHNDHLPYAKDDTEAKNAFLTALEASIQAKGLGGVRSFCKQLMLSDYHESQYHTEVPAKILRLQATAQWNENDKDVCAPLQDFLDSHVKHHAQRYFESYVDTGTMPPAPKTRPANTSYLTP